MASDENITLLVELSVYSINKPKPESLFCTLNTIPSQRRERMKKSYLIEQLEEAGIIDKDVSFAPKHGKLKGVVKWRA